MIQIRNFDQAHRILETYMPPPRSQRGAYTLERIQELMKFLGNPQESYKTIHIAGTSGKTSTVYYSAALLMARGKKVGVTVSPHVDEVNERIQINLVPMPEKQFCSQLSKFIKLIEDAPSRPTYFELLIAFAYWQFKEEAVDYAVIEVGLGGLLDGTNVINRNDKVCIITDIGFDHTQVLGKTLPEITTQKAGIIMPHNAVFIYQQGDEVMKVIREVTSQQQARLHEVIPLKPTKLLGDMPLFQRRNWYLALMANKYIDSRDNLKDIDEAKLAKTTRTYIPARMEIVKIGDKTIIMDGAHNAQKLDALVGSIQEKYSGKPIAVLASFVKSKELRLNSNLNALLPIASHLIITEFATDQDMHKVSVDPLDVARRLDELKFKEWEVERDPVEALKILLSRKEEILLITGSFYLFNHIRPILLKHD